MNRSFISSHSIIRLFLLLLISIHSIDSSTYQRDPYEVLGVSRRASVADIKKTYKALAREWHPDKNDDPNAGEKFMEINRAYEILSDKDKKERYDRFGEFSESPRGDRGHDDFDGFGFANFGNFNFRYNSQNSFFAKHRISLRAYEQSLIAGSFTKPYVIFSYADWCMACHQAESIWEKIVGDLEPIGYGIATVNAMLDGTLLSRLRIQKLPTIVILFEGRVFHYRNRLAPKDVIQFAREVLPPKLVQTIQNDKEVKPFLESWKMNKVSVLVFGNTEKPRIRYILAAIKYQAFARFAYLRTGRGDKAIREALNLKISAGETILIFNEKPETGPVASLSMREMNADSLDNLIESNKYLILPRVSSQAHFDNLCPPSLLANNKKLCAILVVRNGGDDESVHVEGLRDIVELRADLKYSKDQIRFCYVFSDRQKGFLEALRTTSSELEDDDKPDHRDIVVVWRREKEQARYEWLRKIWNGQPEHLNGSADILLNKMDGFLRGKAALSREAVLTELQDEYGPNMYTRFARRVMRLWEQLIFHITREEFLPAVSVAGTLGIIMLIGYCLNYAVSLEEKAERRKQAADARRAAEKSAQRAQAGGDAPPINMKDRKKEEHVLKMMRELRAETYFGMIRLLKPGWRTLVVIVDEQSKESLTREFARAMYPWRNNKTLMFGWVMVPKNVTWFRKLLEYTLPTEDEAGENSETNRVRTADPRLQQINPKQVVGTVLALNGWRLYFSMYHPKHEPSLKGFKGAGVRQFKSTSSGGWLGMEEESDTDEEELEREQIELMRRKTVFKTEELLAGMPNWLDRLFEGSLRRYYIPEWPELK